MKNEEQAEVSERDQYSCVSLLLLVLPLNAGFFLFLYFLFFNLYRYSSFLFIHFLRLFHLRLTFHSNSDIFSWTIRILFQANEFMLIAPILANMRSSSVHVSDQKPQRCSSFIVYLLTCIFDLHQNYSYFLQCCGLSVIKTVGVFLTIYLSHFFKKLERSDSLYFINVVGVNDHSKLWQMPTITEELFLCFWKS